MFNLATVALGLLVFGSLKLILGDNARECRVGNVSLPVDIYEAYAGWECYERIYSKRLIVYVCIEKSEDVEYSVPCFKAGSEMMSFNLKNKNTVLEILNIFRSKEQNDEMIKCYLNLVSACQFSPGGWFGRGYKSFLTNGTDVCALSGQSKFHVAMLSISLIISIPITLIFAICSWDSKNVAVSHCRDVIIALVFRTFFTLLIETEVISKKLELQEEAMGTWAGCEALASFETVTLNLVLAFWLIFTFYLLEYSKNGFGREPDTKKGIYIVLGLSLVLPIIWMIIMGAGEYGMCWLEKTPVNWVNDSLRIGFIIVQIVLISVATHHILTDPAALDDANKDPLRRVIVFTCFISPLFLLQFSLNAGHASDSDNVYVYAEYFFDGMQCGIISLSYLFIMGVHEFLIERIRFRSHKKCQIVLETAGSREVEIGGALKRAHKPEEDYSKDVIYSSVLTPERFEKTIKLYNRLNVIPQNEYPATNEGVLPNNAENSSVMSEYYDIESLHTVYGDIVDDPSPNLTSTRNRNYYNSKYLIHDTDTSVSDDSVKEAGEAEPSGLEMSHQECDGVKAIKSWLRNFPCQFQDHVEREVKNKNYPDSEIHRSLSGNLLSSRGTLNSINVNIKKINHARRASAPAALSLVKPSSFFSSPHENGLPSIYDDLKNSKTFRPRVGRKSPRPKIVIPLGTKNRLLQNRRQVKSMEVMEEPKKMDYRIQLNALLSPRYDAKELEPGDLQNNKFLFSTEQLNIEADDRSDREATVRVNSETA